MTETTTLFLLLFGTAAAVSALGFLRLVWFVSIGYGYAIAAMAVVLGWRLQWGGPGLVAAHLVLLFLYGARLGTHVLRRGRQPAYQQAARASYGEPTAGLGNKVAIWIGVSLLYVTMFSPAAFHGLRPDAGHGVVATGLGLMAAGLILQGWADAQKAAAKRAAPERFCDHGLFAWVRCPAYLGELVFWAGNWVAGVPAYGQWWHWVMALFGLICIVLIMVGATKRLEASQQKRYGQLPEFQRYTQTVPILIPWVRLYSLKGVKWALG